MFTIQHGRGHPARMTGARMALRGREGKRDGRREACARSAAQCMSVPLARPLENKWGGLGGGSPPLDWQTWIPLPLLAIVSSEHEVELGTSAGTTPAPRGRARGLGGRA